MQAFRPPTLSKRDCNTGVFRVNIVTFLRITFFIEYLRWLPASRVYFHRCIFKVFVTVEKCYNHFVHSCMPYHLTLTFFISSCVLNLLN